MTNTVHNTFAKTSRLSALWDDLLSDPVPPRPAAHQRMTTAARLEGGDPVSFPSPPDLKHPSLQVTALWKNSLGKVLHTLMELEKVEPVPPSMDPANSEPEASSDLSIEAAHEEVLSLMSPFRWDPKTAWTNTPLQQRPPFSNAAMPQRPVTRPKIPLRPLHKRPFYLRFFFYLHHWLVKPG